jgi:hypothetical protein
MLSSTRRLSSAVSLAACQMRIATDEGGNQRQTGKILADEKTVESLNFKEGKDFMVVMVAKVRWLHSILATCRKVPDATTCSNSLKREQHLLLLHQLALLHQLLHQQRHRRRPPHRRLQRQLLAPLRLLQLRNQRVQVEMIALLVSSPARRWKALSMR